MYSLLWFLAPGRWEVKPDPKHHLGHLENITYNTDHVCSLIIFFWFIGIFARTFTVFNKLYDWLETRLYPNKKFSTTECSKLAQAWAGSSQNNWAGLARLGEKVKIQALHSLGSKLFWTSELSSAGTEILFVFIYKVSSPLAWGKWRFQAWPNQSHLHQIGLLTYFNLFVVLYPNAH